MFFGKNSQITDKHGQILIQDVIVDGSDYILVNLVNLVNLILVILVN